MKNGLFRHLPSLVIALLGLLIQPFLAGQDELSSGRSPAILLLIPQWKNGNPILPNPSMARTAAFPGKEVWDMLEKRHFSVEGAYVTEQVNLDFLRKFNMLMIGCEPEAAQTPMPSEKREMLAKLLREYLELGGGVWVTRAAGWCYGKDIEYTNEILSPLGAKILNEQVVDREHTHLTEALAKVYWTGNIASHPVTDGVKGIFYPDIVSYGYSMYTDFTSPVEVDGNWQVLIRAAKTASSYERKKGAPRQPERPGKYTTEPPLLAVRQVGQGRIAVFPVTNSIYWQDGYHFYWSRGALMEGSLDDLPGNGLKLVENLVSYLTEPNLGKMGGFQTPRMTPKEDSSFKPIDWTRAHYHGDFMPVQHCVLIGARSSLTIGKDSPQKMIAAAREAGYDSIAFLEPLDKMTAAKLDTLKELCRKESSDSFTAYAGLSYLDESGNAWGAFSNSLTWPQENWFSQKHPGCLVLNNPTTRAWGWPPVIMLTPNRNAERPWHQGNYNALAAFTYDQDNRLLDDGMGVACLLGGDAFAFTTLAVHLVDSCASVKAARGQGFQTWLPWVDSHVIESLEHSIARCKGQYIFARTGFVSEGPLIGDFRIINFGTSDLSIPTNDRRRLHIRVTSDSGLKSIRVFNSADETFRRFLFHGEREVEFECDDWHSVNQCYFLEAVDQQGRRAFSSRANTSIQENSFFRCSDNLNTMPRGKWYGQPEHLQNLRGFEDYSASRDLTWDFRPLVADIGNAGKVPAVHYHPLHVSRYVSLIECDNLEYYPESQNTNPDKTDLPQQAVSNEYFESQVHYTVFTGRMDSSLVKLVEANIRIKQDFVSPCLEVFENPARRSTNWVSYTLADGTVTEKALGGKKGEGRVSAVLPMHGYVALHRDILHGSCGFIPLTENLGFTATGNATGNHHTLTGWLNHDKQFPKGEELTVRYLSVTSCLDPQPGDGFIREVRDKLGILGSVAYSVNPVRGTVDGKHFALQMTAQDYGVLADFSQAQLPLPLPVVVRGLNPNWDAGVVYLGDCQLLLPQWQSNEYGQRFVKMVPRQGRDQLFHIAARQDGTAYVQVETELEPHRVFVGNLLVADVPSLKLTLLDMFPGGCRFECHNPTDESITANVQPARGLDILGDFTRKVQVAAGSSVTITIGQK